MLLSLDRDLNAWVEAEELEHKRGGVVDYLRQRVAVSSSGRELPMESEGFRITRGAAGKALFEVSLRFPSQTHLEQDAIRYEPLSELGPDHRIDPEVIARALRQIASYADESREGPTLEVRAEAVYHLGKRKEVQFFLAIDYYRVSQNTLDQAIAAEYASRSRHALEHFRSRFPGSIEARAAGTLLERLASAQAHGRTPLH